MIDRDMSIEMLRIKYCVCYRNSDDPSGAVIGNSNIRMGYDTFGLTVSREVCWKDKNEKYQILNQMNRRQKGWRQKMQEDY